MAGAHCPSQCTAGVGAGVAGGGVATGSRDGRSRRTASQGAGGDAGVGPGGGPGLAQEPVQGRHGTLSPAPTHVTAPHTGGVEAGVGSALVCRPGLRGPGGPAGAHSSQEGPAGPQGPDDAASQDDDDDILAQVEPPPPGERTRTTLPHRPTDSDLARLAEEGQFFLSPQAEVCLNGALRPPAPVSLAQFRQNVQEARERRRLESLQSALLTDAMARGAMGQFHGSGR